MECEIRDSEFIHYIFKGDSRALSLIVEKHNLNQILASPDEQQDLAGIKINLVNQGSLVIASLESNRHFIYITGDHLNRNEVVDMTKRILNPLKRSLFETRSLRGRNNRNEKVENRGQISPILRRIVALFAEESGGYEPIPSLS